LIATGARDAELGQYAPHRQRRLLDQPEDLQLLGGVIPHVSDSTSPSTLFKQAVLDHQLGHKLFELTSLRLDLLALIAGRFPRRVARQPLLARLKEVFGPAIAKVLVDAFLAAQLSDAVPPRSPSITMRIFSSA
jgi:hypothetical protein